MALLCCLLVVMICMVSVPMGLCDVVSPYVHYVGFMDFMMKVLLGMNEVVYSCLVHV